MDEEKSVSVLGNAVAHKVVFSLGAKQEGKKMWKGEGEVKIYASVDGVNFGDASLSALCYENDANSAIATLMLSLTRQIEDVTFLEKLEKSVRDANKQ